MLQQQMKLIEALRTVNAEGFLSVDDGDVVWSISDLVRCLELSDKKARRREDAWLEQNVRLVNKAADGYCSILVLDPEKNEWTEFYRCFGHYGRCTT